MIKTIHSYLLYILCSLCTLCVSCGGQGNSTERDDSKPTADLTIDTALIQRVEAFVAGRVKMSDEQLCISLYDLTADTTVYQFRSQTPIVPASCLKLLTAIAAMREMGMDYEFHDSLFIKGEIQNGTLYGSVVVKADDDPLFESFDGFAQALSEAGISRIEGDIVLDLARVDTLKAHPTAKTWDIPYHKLPLLLKGHERIRKEFMFQLNANGIRFHENPVFAAHDIANRDASTTPLLHRLAIDMASCGAQAIAGETHRLTEVITPMLMHSSNIKADALYWHLQNVYGRLYNENLVHHFLRKEMDIDYPTSGLIIHDGSGLSPQNRLCTDFLTQLLRYAYGNPLMFLYLIGEALPTPGAGERCGTLQERMANTACVGRIFCKTGTLVTLGGSGLAGFAKGSNRHWYAFAILNIDMPVADARIFQDRFCKEIVK